MPSLDLTRLAFRASLVAIVFGFGLQSSARDALWVLRRPSWLARSLGAMFVVMPLGALALAFAFELRFPVRVALVALALSPVPPLWPRRALASGIAVPFAIGLLVAASLVSIVSIPVSLGWIGSLLGRRLNAEPMTIARIVSISVLLPLGAGILVHAIVPDLARRIARVVHVGGELLLVAGAILLLLRVAPLVARLIGDGTLAVITFFVTLGLIVGYFCGGPDDEHRSLLAVAASSRHPAIAAAIVAVNFPDQPLALAAIVLYLLVSAAVIAPFLSWHRHRPVDTTPHTASTPRG